MDPRIYKMKVKLRYMRANIRYELLKIQNEQSKPISPRDDKAGKKVCQKQWQNTFRWY